MKNKLSLWIALLAIPWLLSCEKEGVTSIQLDKNQIAFHVGQSDTIIAVIRFNGEINRNDIKWTSSNARVAEWVEDSRVIWTENSTTRKLAIKANEAGTTRITLQAGHLTTVCEIIVTQRSFSFQKGYGFNWGDFYDTNTNNFELYLLENGLTLTENREISGSGTFIYFDFNVPITQNEFNNATFTASNEGVAETFYPGQHITYNGENHLIGSKLVVRNGSQEQETSILSGTFGTFLQGNNLRVDGELITETNEVISISFTGPVTLEDKKPVPEVIVPTLSKGKLLYFGDAYSSGTNNFVALLASEAYDFNATQLKGQVLMLEFNTPLSFTNQLPNLRFNTINEIKKENIVAGTLIPGFTTEEGNRWGCWFFTETSTLRLKNGFANVTKTGEIYHIEYELYDRFGSKIVGEYRGTLTFENRVSAPAANRIATPFKRVKSIH